MNFYLTVEEDNVKDLKDKLGIKPSKPHCLNVELWRHGNSNPLQLQCRISVFTNDDKCVQGTGANFGDAFEALRSALKPQSRNLDPNDEVKVIVEEK